MNLPIPEGVLICRLGKKGWLIFPEPDTRNRHYVFAVDTAEAAWEALVPL